MREGLIVRTPLKRPCTIDDITDAATFLLESPAVNRVNLEVDCGWMLL